MDWIGIADLDLMQIVYSILGSFFGFCFALRMDKMIAKKTENSNIEQTKNNLNDELKHISECYFDHRQKKYRTERIYMDTPIWDSIISRGDLLALLNKDKEYYNDVISVYSKVNNIDRLETDLAILKREDLDRDRIKIIIETIDKDKKEVVDWIDSKIREQSIKIKKKLRDKLKLA